MTPAAWFCTGLLLGLAFGSTTAVLVMETIR